MLIDWDLCKYVGQDDYTGIRRKTRTGTWQFMAVPLVDDPNGRVHELRYDLESFVHVLFYYVLRYRKTYKEKQRLLENLRTVFDRAACTEDGEMQGGEAKQAYLTNIGYFNSSGIKKWVKPRTLGLFMNSIRRAFTPIYATVEDSECSEDDMDSDFYEKEDTDAALDKRRAALERLAASDYMLDLFKKAFDNPKRVWPEDDCAVDQFPEANATSLCVMKRSRAKEDTGSGSSQSKVLRTSRSATAGSALRESVIREDTQ